MKLTDLTKKLLAIACVMTISISTLCAAEPVVYQLWPEGAPTGSGLDPSGYKDDNKDWIVGVTDPTVTVFPADSPNGTTLLMCPGGAYAGLAFAHEGTDLAKVLNEKGITLAVLKYRMPNGHSEVPADDVWRAYDLICDNSSSLGIDPAKIGIGGASAGGHLATTAATHPRDGKGFAFQMLFYPVVTMEALSHPGSRANLLGENPPADKIELYSNEHHVTPDTPRAFIVLSADDDVVPMENSIHYYEALKANGIPAYLHVFPIGGHGWLCRDRFKYNAQVVQEAAEWLDSLYD